MPDVTSITITIDGPAGAGKSTVARGLACRLGIDFLDTGAMYRGAAVVALMAGINLEDGPAIAAAVDRSRLRFDWDGSPPRLLIDWPEALDISRRIREADATKAVTPVSAQPAVRAAMVQRQRAIRDEHPQIVTEGRDQGSVVFPDAGVKFYLDASPETRACRRALELREAGREVDEQQILEGILARDHADQSRADGPLCVPEGAIVVDTTDLTLEQVIALLDEYVKTARAQAPRSRPADP
ncbi:MAG: (d)CMP kinase [Planctomycetes bacterium]|nr:(d)CMP kinase [Planctomycetota bacterium]NOG55823.1 (d)CMP kinase [Planctomycetota bacterium]